MDCYASSLIVRHLTTTCIERNHRNLTASSSRRFESKPVLKDMSWLCWHCQLVSCKLQSCGGYQNCIYLHVMFLCHGYRCAVGEDDACQILSSHVLLHGDNCYPEHCQPERRCHQLCIRKLPPTNPAIEVSSHKLIEHAVTALVAYGALRNPDMDCIHARTFAAQCQCILSVCVCCSSLCGSEWCMHARVVEIV